MNERQAANVARHKRTVLDAECRDFVKSFVDEWDATWVDPEDVNHEWSELYATAKRLLAAVNEQYEAKP